MPETVLNIVAFDIPYPATYGGSIDIFYKLKTLKEKGVGVILHCFKYNKSEQPELEKYCKSVVYYPRKKGLKFLFSPLPYIVITRKHQQLLKSLKANDFPILFEGLHSCALLDAPELKNRKKIVRTHNIEHDYYSGLQKASKNLFTKTYYTFESRKLKRYEPVLQHANAIVSISPNDFEYFSKRYENVVYIPAFHPFSELKTKPGKGMYFLYHGNLTVEENDLAVNFLIDQVFNKVQAKLIVAGKDPGKTLVQKISKLPNVTLQSNPSEEQMNNLLKNAQACVLPTFQGTGLKLKLLTSLFSSRYVIVNPTMVSNTGLESLCEVADHAEEFIAAINKISSDEFTTEQIKGRKQKLVEFTNAINCDKLLKIIEEL